MVASSNKHDVAISLLLKNKAISAEFFDYLQQNEYFFQNRTVDVENFKLMERRKIFMQMNESYVSALIPLGIYFEKNNTPLLMSEFVLDKGSIYIFSDENMNKVITWYSSSNVNRKKINSINEECLVKGHTPMNYESYNYSSQNAFEI